jgi:hypothetical protein
MLVRHLSPTGPARRGVTAVEAALLLSIFLMFLFGVLEYCRYLLVLHTTTNAARDGARYASVRASNVPTNWVVTPGTDPDFGSRPVYEITNPTKDGLAFDKDDPWGVTRYVQDRSRTHNMITNYKVRIYPCDTSELYGTAANGYTPQFLPKPPGSSWNSVTFSERMAVRVTGTYRPILPNFLWMGNTATIKITAVTGSEG